jgi:tripartite-type tricarboxylate transporter receptor subunit TctC
MIPLQFDLLKDLEPVAFVANSPLWVVAKKDLIPRDLKEFIAWLKANPDKATAATVGVGSGSHMCGIYIQNATGTKFQFVPYRGGAPAVQDLVAGQVDFMCDFAGNSLPWVRNRQIKPYVVMAKARWFAAPEVPTFEEMGIPGLVMGFWHGLWLPRGTPADVVSKLTARCVRRSPTRPSSSATSTWVRNCRHPSSRRQRRSPRIRKPRSKNGGRS